MKELSKIVCGVLLAATVVARPAGAEMTITLSDGKKVVLPYDSRDVSGIRFGDGTTVQIAPPRAETAGKRPESETGRVLKVGPGEALKLPSQAASTAKDNDVIEIAAGLYVGDVAIWRANNLTIRGVGGRVRIDASGNAAEGKAIWVVKGRNTIIEDVEFIGARVADRNGAGIRQEGAGLIVRRCLFRANEMGILTGSNRESDILIEYSEFDGNTVDYRRYGRLGHNVYVGDVRSFTLRYSYAHGAQIGHNVKSRAAKNSILYNRIIDGDAGGSSYLVDLSNGGRSYVIGNLFHQSPRNDNNRLIAFASEGDKAAASALFVINNTFVNDDRGGTMVANRSAVEAVLVNNIFVGPGHVLDGPGSIRNSLIVRQDGGMADMDRFLFGESGPAGRSESGNRLAPDAGFVDRAGYDYRLQTGSAAIDAGIEPGADGARTLLPEGEYVAPTNGQRRQKRGPIDIGAYEFVR